MQTRYRACNKLSSVVVLLFLILMLLETGCVTSKKSLLALSKAQTTTPDLGEVKSEIRFQNYIFRVFYSDETGGSFVIYHKNKPVVRETGVIGISGTAYRVISPGEDPEPPPDVSPNIIDITGDGIPDLVVETFSGGAHCCYTYYLYSLGKKFKPIAVLETKDSSLRFQDLDGDSIYEILGRDYTFAYWQTYFADSPAPEVILRHTGEGYHLALDLMRKSPPSEEELSKQITDVRRQFGDPVMETFQDPAWRTARVPSSLWETMLDLIYGGNSQVAWDFFSRAWPKNEKGENEFLAAFKAKLQTSPYWADLKTTMPSPE